MTCPGLIRSGFDRGRRFQGPEAPNRLAMPLRCPPADDIDHDIGGVDDLPGLIRSGLGSAGSPLQGPRLTPNQQCR
jgi:hypothetical protein